MAASILRLSGRGTPPARHTEPVLSPRPVVALDVDGVVNAGPTEASVAHRVYVPAERVPASPFIRGYGATDMDVVVHLDPTVGAWITGLRRHADVYWATTWERLANEMLAPLLGVDPLPLAMTVATYPPRFGYARNADSVGWKASVLRERFNGRPLVWIDDGAWEYTNRYADEVPEGQLWFDWRAPPAILEHQRDTSAPDEREHVLENGESFISAPTLAVVPSLDLGLTAGHRATVEEFLVNPYAYVSPLPGWASG